MFMKSLIVFPVFAALGNSWWLYWIELFHGLMCYFLNILNYEWVSERVNTCLKLCRVSFSKRKRIRKVFFLITLWHIWIIHNFPINFTFWARHHWFTKVKRVKHSVFSMCRDLWSEILHNARQLRYSQFTGMSNHNEILYGTCFFPNRIPNLQWYSYTSEQGPKLFQLTMCMALHVSND